MFFTLICFAHLSSRGPKIPLASPKETPLPSQPSSVRSALILTSLELGQSQHLRLLSTATSWLDCCPGGSLSPSLPKHFPSQPPRTPCWFLMASMLFSRNEAQLLLCEIFLSTPWLWPLKNMQTGPNPHPEVIKCWGFPSPKSYPSCDRTKMTLHVLQTSPATSCQRGIWTSKTVLWAFMTQNPGERGRAKDVPAADGEEFWSKKWRSSLRPGYPQGHPDVVRFGMDLQLHLPSFEPWCGLLQSLGKGAPISNWSAQIRLFKNSYKDIQKANRYQRCG